MQYKRNQELRLKPEFAYRVNWAKQHDVLSVVWVNSKLGRAAIANMSNAFGLDPNGKTLADNGKRKKAYQFPKPKVYTFEEIDRMFSCVNVGKGVRFFRLPKMLREPDQVLSQEQYSKWKEKNDRAIDRLGDLISEDSIESYLLGYDFKEKLDKHMDKLAESDVSRTYSSPTALTRHLNQYITFSGSILPLIPLGYMNCGSNYKHSTDKEIIKRGAGGADGRNARTNYRAITPVHKKLIKKLARQFGTSMRNGALRYTDMYLVYCVEALELSNVVMPEGDEKGDRDLSKFEPFVISYGAFRGHYLNMLPITERLLLRYGQIRAQRDFMDRQGHAIDMNLGANDVVEIDSTEISMHVRDPRVGDKRMSAGRLFLCMAVCVRTRYILGYSLSFKPPCWENVAECLYNILEDKKEYCARYGIQLKAFEWISHHLFGAIRIDNGIEYPEDEVDELVASAYGCGHVQTVTKGRGDLKAVIERLIGYFDRMVSTMEGGIEADRDQTEQNASQRALHSVDDVHRKIIREIITENLRKDCSDLMDSDMAQQNIGISPHSLWTYSMEDQMGGGHPIDKSELPHYRYTLLPKDIVKVDEHGVHYNGLLFCSEYAKSQKWYIKAKYTGNVSKRMAYTPSLCDCLFYEDDEGVIHTFALADQREQYSGLSWEEVKERKAYVNELRLDNKRQKAADKVANTIQDKKDREAAENSAKTAPKNDQIGYQTGTVERRREIAVEQSKDIAKTIHTFLTEPSDESSSTFSEEDAI
jgi:putative transposase